MQGESEIRAEFSKLDADNSGYITKGGDQSRKNILKSYNYLLSDEMISVITDCDHFSGDKVRQWQEAKTCPLQTNPYFRPFTL